jgi:putative transposase
MKGEHSIELGCDVLGVSRSGYYKWRGAGPGIRQRQDALLSERIAVAHRKSRCNYGTPRIVEDLRAEGLPIGRRRCGRLMKDLGLCGRKKPRRKPRTTDSRHGKAVAPNLLAASPPPTAANQIWVTDITYLETGEGYLFLAVVLDGWSRRAVGWACAPTLAAPLVIAAFNDARLRRQPPPGTIHHSDRGSQYVAADLLAALAEACCVRSMSRAGNCYDNAKIESFWSTLKAEGEFDVAPPRTRKEAELAVFDYIETFYNPRRRHSSLGQISPVAFELKYSKNNIKAA